MLFQTDPRFHYLHSHALVDFTRDFFAWNLGSVLVHNTKTDLHRCDVLQPEVVPEAVIIKARTSGA